MLRREREERHPRRGLDRDTAEAADLQAGERELQVRADRDEVALGARSVAGRDPDQRVSTVQATHPAHEFAKRQHSDADTPALRRQRHHVSHFGRSGGTHVRSYKPKYSGQDR